MDETTEWLRVPAAEPGTDRREAAERRRNTGVAPLGSLGRLEETALRLAALQGTKHPRLDKITLVVLAADHGAVADDVSTRPPSAETVRSIARGDAPVSLLAREIGAILEVMDLGVATDLGAEGEMLDLRIAPGTADFRYQPAMTRHQLARAMHAGRHAAERARLRGAQLFVAGAVGNGSRTSAVTLASALLAAAPGLAAASDTRSLAHIEQIADQALRHHRHHLGTPLEALRRLGGFELAALTGSYMACAHMGLPILVDGFVTAVAALAAVRLCPGAQRWLLAAQSAAAPCHPPVLEALDMEPLTDLGLPSEDGTAAAAVVPVLRLACSWVSTLLGAAPPQESAGLQARPR